MVVVPRPDHLFHLPWQRWIVIGKAPHEPATPDLVNAGALIPPDRMWVA